MPLIANTSFVHAAANAATILFAIVIALQILLALGILPVSMAWGGRQSKLTPALRIASIVAVGLLCFFIYIIRYRAGLFGDPPIPMFVKVVSWIITLFMALNTLGNFTSRSRAEKFTFTPITFLLTVACLIVSVSG